MLPSFDSWPGHSWPELFIYRTDQGTKAEQLVYNQMNNQMERKTSIHNFI